MTVNIDESPGIWAILERYRPTRHPGRRAVQVDEPSDVHRELIEDVALELENAQVVDGLDGAGFATLASAAASARGRFSATWSRDGGATSPWRSPRPLRSRRR